MLTLQFSPPFAPTTKQSSAAPKHPQTAPASSQRQTARLAAEPLCHVSHHPFLPGQLPPTTHNEPHRTLRLLRPRSDWLLALALLVLAVPFDTIVFSSLLFFFLVCTNRPPLNPPPTFSPSSPPPPTTITTTTHTSRLDRLATGPTQTQADRMSGLQHPDQPPLCHSGPASS